MADGRALQPPVSSGAIALSIEGKIGHKFADKKLLHVALTHASSGAVNNERLEFLGDRVLGLAVAQLLYRQYVQESEGDLAKRLTALVQQSALLRVAQNIGLAAELQLSAGERSAGEQVADAILADGVEALIGAVFIDGGYAMAEKVVAKLWGDLLSQQPAPPEDSKTALQEWVQARGLPLPVYTAVAQSGPAHAPLFTIELSVKGHASITAKAANKRAAEKEAARLMLERLENEV